MSLDPELVNEIAIELGVAPAFVEKDWYAVQVLQCIANLEDSAVTTIFSGGTSLSKGHGLLKRFSEDLDFRAKYNTDTQNKSTRRAFRKKITSAIEDIEDISTNQNKLDAGSNYFKFPLEYPHNFEESPALRPELKIEFSFTQPRLTPETQPISSFITEFNGEPPELEILCLSPVEIAADKLSALTWRVLKRDRKSAKDDPALVRHLHDLCALKVVVDKNTSEFIETSNLTFEEDQERSARATNMDLKKSIGQAGKILKEDLEYQGEYTRFVDAMSYASDDENIDFSKALKCFEEFFDYF